LLNIDAPATAIAELERNISLSEDIIRSMIIRVEELEAGPSAVMRKSERSESREGGDDFGGRPRRPRPEGGREGGREGRPDFRPDQPAA
jgi:small subunit ribosomal protein S6